jgi:hypothetical protein
VAEDIFSEIDGDLRAERNAVRNRKLAAFGLAFLVVAGLCAGVWAYVVHLRHERAVAVAGPYFAAQTDADTAPSALAGPNAPLTPEQVKARTAFAAVAARAPEGFATLSRLRMAALAWEAKDHDTAFGLWDQIAKDGSADPDLRGLGTLLWVQHRVDDGDPALLKTRLRDLTVPGSPWRLLALETDALIDLRTGHVAEARTKLITVSQDASASQGERDRASGLLDTLDTSKTGG